MDNYRALLAIILSFVILAGYQFFIARPVVQQTATEPEIARQQSPLAPVNIAELSAPAVTAFSPPPAAIAPEVKGRDITVETPLYKAIFTENGGGVKSFRLKQYKESIEQDAAPKELIKTEAFGELPLLFSWGAAPANSEIPRFTAERDTLLLEADSKEASLTMSSRLENGLEISRSMLFDSHKYLIHLVVEVRNTTQTALQGGPHISMTNRPFTTATGARFLFTGPALLLDNELMEIKTDDIKEGAVQKEGIIQWAIYEATYFMTGIIPENPESQSARMTADGDKVTTVLAGAADILEPGGSKQYAYDLYFGPKKLSTLEEAGADLDRALNFGWFDIVAKPTLRLLNALYGYIGNYGIAIIMVTILFKLILWPISQKGLKSMKNMQKIQPKMAKLREKYKNDSTRLNQEMMNLYKTYKVNPLGGCLPMFLQIPVFFALYKVLLQAIEVRHAPFMLWITDLSAPDRLWIGVDIPYLGGIPVLTLLMGASMFLQQKMTPTAADPTQAKVMMFLPVIFTFMFLNFASGLVLYWFINNLLSIGQQYLINKSSKA